ncbi:MAG: hypothetical protein NT049_07220, partial [Planctomycetota bacterium]|nr:hypothetical protein [Planctomycetota bacterium]
NANLEVDVTVEGAGNTGSIMNFGGTFTRITSTSGAGDLLLTGANQQQIGGTLANNKITIGEGWSGGTAGGRVLLNQAGTTVSGLTNGFVVSGGAQLTAATAVAGGTYSVKGDPLGGGKLVVADPGFAPTSILLDANGTLVVQADATLPVSSASGGRVQLDKSLFAGTLQMNTAADAMIGLGAGDTTIANVITGTAQTLTFQDAQTAALSGYVLTLGSGIGNADGGAARAVVINRNMVLNGASAYTGGTTISTGDGVDTSAANDVFVVVQNTQALGLGNVEVKATGGKASTLAIGAAGFDLGDGDLAHSIKVSAGGKLQFSSDTPVNLTFNGGLFAATANVTATGLLAATSTSDTTFDIAAGKKLTFAPAAAGPKKDLGGGIALPGSPNWTINNGTVQFGGPVTVGSEDMLIMSGNGTLRLQSGANDIPWLETAQNAGGTVIVGPSGKAPTRVSLQPKSAYSVEKADYAYDEVLTHMSSAKGVIALGADSNVGYNFDYGSSGDNLSTLSLGAAMGKTVSYTGTLTPDTGVIYPEGTSDIPSTDMPG